MKPSDVKAESGFWVAVESVASSAWLCPKATSSRETTSDTCSICSTPDAYRAEGDCFLCRDCAELLR